MRLAIILAVLSLHTVYILFLDLRLSYVLEMWIDLLWGYQTLIRKWVVIKVTFGFFLKHAARHGHQDGICPSLHERDISGPLE